jgi:hypothetical protein
MLSRCRVAFADVCQMVLQMDERLNLDLTIALLQFVPKQEEVCMPSLRPCINIGDTNNVACSSMPFVLSKEMWRSSINPNNLSVPSWYVAHTHTHTMFTTDTTLIHAIPVLAGGATMQHVPMYAARLQAHLIRLSLPERLNEIRTSCENIAFASSELAESAHFQKMLVVCCVGSTTSNEIYKALICLCLACV